MLRLLIGDLVVGQKVELVLRVRFPEVPAGAQTTAFFTIGDRDGVLKADGCTLAWQHASHAANDAQPRDRDVDRAVARIYAARARLEAVRLQPHRRVQRCPSRPPGRGPTHRALRRLETPSSTSLAGPLVAEEAAFAAPMAEIDRKRAHFASANMQRSRDPDGQARR